METVRQRERAVAVEENVERLDEQKHREIASR